MLPADFGATFNQAIETQDWSLVIVLGEQAVAENAASSSILYNLGLAYLKQNKPSMATAAFLAVPVSERDSKTIDALRESLRLTEGSMDDLSLGAHGIKGGLVTMVEDIPDKVVPAVFSSGLVLLIFVLMAEALTVNPRRRQWIKLLMVFSLLLAVSGAGGFALRYWYDGDWGTVTADGMAAMMTSPDEASPVIANLKSGRPILALGAKEGPWVRVWDSDGHQGWIKSLDVRVITPPH